MLVVKNDYQKRDLPYVCGYIFPKMETLTADLQVAQAIIIRIVVSFILGVIIGIERGISHNTIGFRTLSLVCVGSAAFTLISIYGFQDVDTARVAAQIVTGIGFLGAGAILHKGYITKGLTTAAALRVTAAIGMACGCGMFILASIMTLMALILLWVLKPFKKRLDSIIDRDNQDLKSDELDDGEAEDN